LSCADEIFGRRSLVACWVGCEVVTSFRTACRVQGLLSGSLSGHGSIK
jgi:hypothetical protein